MAEDFHQKPFDTGTLTKLRIFELYAQEWIPVFLAPAAPKFNDVHIFDFFCGPGKDSIGVDGSPLRLLTQLRNYHEKRMAGWDKVPITVHLYAWANDEIAGEANFDIERDNISPGEGILNLDVMRPNKQRGFEAELSTEIKAGRMKTEADVVKFCIEAGMTCRHSMPVLKQLKAQGIIDLDFQVPDIRRLKAPRAIRMIQ